MAGEQGSQNRYTSAELAAMHDNELIDATVAEFGLVSRLLEPRDGRLDPGDILGQILDPDYYTEGGEPDVRPAPLETYQVAVLDGLTNEIIRRAAGRRGHIPDFIDREDGRG